MTATAKLPTAAKLLKQLVATDLPEAMRLQIQEMLTALMEGEVSLDVHIPRLRSGSYFPSFLEPHCRLHTSLCQVVTEAYTQGISTRKIDELAQALGMSGISKSSASRMLAALQEGVEEFCGRTLPPCPYAAVDPRARGGV